MQVTNGTFSSAYFKIHCTLPAGWIQKWEGPPPSDNGRYVLAQIRSADTHAEEKRGSILITAQDMFFTPQPARNALELMSYVKDNLQADYRMEQPATRTQIGGRPFVFLAYWSPVAELHWYVMATEIRCPYSGSRADQSRYQIAGEHAIGPGQNDIARRRQPHGGNRRRRRSRLHQGLRGGQQRNYKNGPIFSESKFNPVPVRIIIDKQGNVKHIHFLSAFGDQARAITDAMAKWKFKPYLREGRPVEVETGIMFGRAARPIASQATNGAIE